MKDLINKKVDELADDLIASVIRLVNIKSVEEKPSEDSPFGKGPRLALEEALKLSEELGFTTKNMDNYAGYAQYGKGGDHSDYIGIFGHLDVVPEGDGWKYEPYGGQIDQGKMYGRGTADMKAGLMASIMAVKLLQDSGYKLPGDVKITSVCDEEGGGNGSMQAIMSGQTADGVVVCEGTDYELILAHMGFVFFRVEFEGKPCHSGTKIDGVSAIDKAFKVIEALNEKEHQWLLQYKHPLLPAPNLNVGVIHGGSAGSTVAGDCYFETCVHYIPNKMSHNQVVDEFNEVIRRVSLSDPWLEEHPPKVTIYQSGHGYEMDDRDELVLSFETAYEDSLRKVVDKVGSPSGCDSRLWRNIAKVPTIQYGPGALAQAHATDEYVVIDEYLDAILIYANLILEYTKNK